MNNGRIYRTKHTNRGIVATQRDVIFRNGSCVASDRDMGAKRRIEESPQLRRYYEVMTPRRNRWKR